MKKIRLAHLSAEVSPYSQTGGLADVTRSLPRALCRMGHQVIVITPFYKFIRKQNLPLEDLSQAVSLSFADYHFNFSFKKVISEDKYPVFFVVQDELFSERDVIYKAPDDALRFLFFDLAALELLKILKFSPDVLHCHDWHTGLVPYFLKTLYKEGPELSKIATLFTIHNLSFQGAFNWWEVPREKKDDGGDISKMKEDNFHWINFMKRGIMSAEIINTVSECYAQEILTKEFGCGLEGFLQEREERLFGIINGIDYKVFNPKFDPDVHVNYDADSFERKTENKIALQQEFNLTVDERTPMIGLAHRLTEQKGIELLIKILEELLKLNVQIVIVGTGEESYVEALKKFKKKHTKKIVFITPFEESWARKIYAASDIYLLPSRFEPCGLSQLISLRYGSVPVVRAVGGLSDTVTNYNPGTGRGNGFVFRNYSEIELLAAIVRALENYKRKSAWKKLACRAMKETYSWNLPAKKYVALYKKALKKKMKNL